ncbi:hypothetical protein LCM20_13075 [Halobacillus litoralis]|uniref:hypothetical protein n=1 Tax=Halobacillus litoralis TaxID=45668 RepID=UPI001CD6B051|nr:hypothetical protein [Halobacillus litoralis]MCA0971532.1 hypothetical protein [Halobacillus litoralis]
MQQPSRSLTPVKKIWLDDSPTGFTHAFVERLAYEWMVEIVNPVPIPLMENRDYVLTLSFEQTDGSFYPSINIESYEIMEGNEFTVYRFFMYPAES